MADTPSPLLAPRDPLPPRQAARTEARVELQPNPMLKEKAEEMLPPEAVAQLDRVDALLDFKEANANPSKTASSPKAVAKPRRS